jgi:hypothetical protein
VRTGQAEGSIDVQVRCNPIHKGEPVGFDVWVGRGHARAIRAFQRRPIVQSGGGVSHRGSCVRDKHSPKNHLRCEARAGGSILIEARMWVANGDGCDSNVALTSRPTSGPCKGACFTDDVVVFLASGPPKGC